MDRVTQVLEKRADEIAEHLVLRQEFDRDVARRFVEVASDELIASWEWQASSVQLEDLASWTNVQRLLAGIHANGVASRLDLPAEQVWRALRTFVPRVLILAARGPEASAEGPAQSSRRPRRSDGTAESRTTVTW